MNQSKEKCQYHGANILSVCWDLFMNQLPDHELELGKKGGFIQNSYGINKVHESCMNARTNNHNCLPIWMDCFFSQQLKQQNDT